MAYNRENGITPQTVMRSLDESLAGVLQADYADLAQEEEALTEFASQADLDAYLSKLEGDMREAAKAFEFERAAKLRDTIRDLRSKEFLFS